MQRWQMMTPKDIVAMLATEERCAPELYAWLTEDVNTRPRVADINTEADLAEAKTLFNKTCSKRKCHSCNYSEGQANSSCIWNFLKENVI